MHFSKARSEGVQEEPGFRHTRIHLPGMANVKADPDIAKMRSGDHLHQSFRSTQIIGDVFHQNPDPQRLGKGAQVLNRSHRRLELMFAERLTSRPDVLDEEREGQHLGNLKRTLDLVHGFDALRPVEAQWALWNVNPDPEFLADPRRGSPHSRGAAVDLTLLDAEGLELDMGTGFDAFTPLSHHGRTDVPAAAQRNRLLLMGLMTAAGWDFYRNEWWHYQLFDARHYPLICDADLARPMM